jgi:hypothetical protein
MNPIHALSEAFADTYKLEKRYYWLTREDVRGDVVEK